jgi:hypothetical protein
MKFDWNRILKGVAVCLTGSWPPFVANAALITAWTAPGSSDGPNTDTEDGQTGGFGSDAHAPIARASTMQEDFIKIYDEEKKWKKENETQKWFDETRCGSWWIVELNSSTQFSRWNWKGKLRKDQAKIQFSKL